MKRFERIKILADKKEWTPEKSVFGLQKVKSVRIRMKKEKAAEAAPVAGTSPATETQGTATPKAAAPKAAPGKPSGGKETPKK